MKVLNFKNVVNLIVISILIKEESFAKLIDFTN